jgi:hypothetical protein
MATDQPGGSLASGRDVTTGAGQTLTRKNNPSDNGVQRTRAWTGLWVVVGGDVAIAAAAIFAVWKVGSSSGSSYLTSMVAILTSAFTAIGTMTTAYFGIKTMSNTAQSFAPAVNSAISNMPGGQRGTGGQTGPGSGHDPSNPTPPGGSTTPPDGTQSATATPPSPTAPATTGSATSSGPSGPPIPANPKHPTDAEIVARMAEPPHPVS